MSYINHELNLAYKLSIEIKSARFYLRILTLADVNDNYLGWFNDVSTKNFIVSAQSTKSLVDLRKYVEEKLALSSSLFLGIFSKNDHAHIGNIKFEPIDRQEKFAVMGILIGSNDWRGKGVAAEILDASTVWLRGNLGIQKIYLGVEKENIQAIRAYEKAGFVFVDFPFLKIDPNRGIGMCLNLD